MATSAATRSRRRAGLRVQQMPFEKEETEPGEHRHRAAREDREARRRAEPAKRDRCGRRAIGRRRRSDRATARRRGWSARDRSRRVRRGRHARPRRARVDRRHAGKQVQLVAGETPGGPSPQPVLLRRGDVAAPVGAEHRDFGRRPRTELARVRDVWHRVRHRQRQRQQRAEAERADRAPAACGLARPSADGERAADQAEERAVVDAREDLQPEKQSGRAAPKRDRAPRRTCGASPTTSAASTPSIAARDE